MGVAIQLVLFVGLFSLVICIICKGEYWHHVGLGATTIVLSIVLSLLFFYAFLKLPYMLYELSNPNKIWWLDTILLLITAIICGAFLIAGALFFKYKGQCKAWKKETDKDIEKSNKVLKFGLLAAEIFFFVALTSYKRNMKQNIAGWFSVTSNPAATAILQYYTTIESLVALALFAGGLYAKFGKKRDPNARLKIDKESLLQCAFNSFVLGIAVNLTISVCFIFTQKSFLPSSGLGMLNPFFYLNYDENREKFEYSYYEYYGYSYMTDAGKDKDFLKETAKKINAAEHVDILGLAVQIDKPNEYKIDDYASEEFIEFLSYYLDAYVEVTKKGFENGIMIVVFSLIVFHYEIRKKIEDKDVDGAWDGRVQALIRTIPLVLMFGGMWMSLELGFKDIFYERGDELYAFSKFSLMDSLVTGVEYGGVIAAIWIFIKKPEEPDSGRRRVGSRKIYTRRR